MLRALKFLSAKTQTLSRTQSQLSRRGISNRRSYPQSWESETNSKTLETGAQVVGAISVALASAYVYEQAQVSTEKKPITNLKFTFSKLMLSEAQKRKSGIEPKKFVHAAQLAEKEGDIDAAFEWYKKMLVVHPEANEISDYYQAADFIFKTDGLKTSLKERLYLVAVFWEYCKLEPVELNALSIKAGHKLFEAGLIEDAISFWEKAASKLEMAVFLEKAGNAYKAQGDMTRAVTHWRRAVDYGLRSIPTLMELSQYHLTRDNKGIDLAQEELHLITQLNPNDSLAHHELGVAYVMNACTWGKNETFYNRIIAAIDCFEESLRLNPNNDIAKKNLEIAKTLTNLPQYGSPNRKLKPISGQPTFILDALISELTANREFTRPAAGGGLTTVNTYDNYGNVKDTQIKFVPTVTFHTEIRAENEIALASLHSLKARYQLEKHQAIEHTSSSPGMKMG